MTVDYWKRWPAPLTFTNIGDEAVGEVVAPADVDTKFPELHIKQDDGIVRVVRVTHARLHELLVERIPQAGDRIRIRYIGDGKAAPGMAPAKQFTVEIKRKGSPPQGGGTGVRGSAPENATPEAGIK